MGLGLGLALGFSLALDAFAVSCAIPLCVASVSLMQTFRVAFTFGLFQMVMPLFGWFFADRAIRFVSPVDHWVAFILLGFVGGKMIIEGLKARAGCRTFEGDPTNGKLLLVLALGTSIDAMAVGVSFPAMQIDVIPTVVLIGLVTFLLCLVGIVGSKRLCAEGGGKWEMVGGVVLIALGTKILAEHLGWL